MSKNFLIILAALVVGFVGFIFFQGKKDSSNNTNSNTTVQASEHKKGAGNKKVTIVEYGDFQCPSCAAFEPVVAQTVAKYGDDITFQFRHFPLTQIHKNAMVAHRAAEAAAKQDKFWQMHDILYQRQSSWGESNNATQIMQDYATELGMNVEKFKLDYQSSATNDIINADIAAGNQLKVTGTPTFFINGERVDNQKLQNIEDFNKLIEDAIKKSSS